MKILRAADHIAEPWKNVGGVTRQIAVHPPGAGLDDFDWRVSMATVDAGGPFSRFAGIDRILAVLRGRLTLSIDGGAPIELDAGSSPIAFAGDIPVEAAVLDGPVTDLNVMTRRGRASATLERLDISAPSQVDVTGPTIILARTDGVEIAHAGQRHILVADDAVLFDGAADAVQIGAPEHSMAFIIRFM